MLRHLLFGSTGDAMIFRCLFWGAIAAGAQYTAHCILRNIQRK